MSALKYVPKHKIIKVLKSNGHENINLNYFKSEGWRLESNLFDGWLGIASIGAYRTACELNSAKKCIQRCDVKNIFFV